MIDRGITVAMRRVLLLLAFVATPALADPQVYRLSPAEREAAIAAGANRPETGALLPEPMFSHLPAGSLYDDGTDGRRDRRIHGEFGVVAGTGGTLGFYGTAVVPIGETSTATISVAHGQGQGFGYGGYGAGYGGYGFGSPFGAFGNDGALYPFGYVSPGFPAQLLPGPLGRRPNR
jgi:hypothetical protein